MVEDPIILAGLMKRVGNYDSRRFADSFEQRLVLQKTIYLMQEGFNIPLGYQFNWYLRGPYCPRLAQHGYEMINLYKYAHTRRFKDGLVERKFNQFLAFINQLRSDSHRLEVAACILYLSEAGHDKHLIRLLLMRKGLLHPEDIFEEIWDYLSKWDLLVNNE